MSKTSISLPIKNVEWPVSNVRAFTTLRQVESEELADNHENTLLQGFDSFNLGAHVGDDIEQVAANRQLLTGLLPPNTKVQWLDQVHGAQVVTLTKHHQHPIVADAAITQSPDIALAVMTADCLPILLAHRDGSEVAAIHGGWRPLAGNIIKNTVDQMHSAADDLIAWLGPCIGLQAFEVGSEVKAAFVAISPKLSEAFKPSINEGKFMADLQAIAAYLLAINGVRQCYRLSECTYSKANTYYSYRRERQTGRMATIICRK